MAETTFPLLEFQEVVWEQGLICKKPKCNGAETAVAFSPPFMVLLGPPLLFPHPHPLLPGHPAPPPEHTSQQQSGMTEDSKILQAVSMLNLLQRSHHKCTCGCVQHIFKLLPSAVHVEVVSKNGQCYVSAGYTIGDCMKHTLFNIMWEPGSLVMTIRHYK